MQNFELKREKLTREFTEKFRNKDISHDKLAFSWSNWGFGIERLEKSLARLQKNDITYVELHGNLYGNDLGYKSNTVRRLLKDSGIEASGVCGMFGAENDLSSNSGQTRQAAIDYIRRQLDFCHDVGGSYLLVVPAAVGRPAAYDESEFFRSVETLQIVADDFVSAGVRGAIEPIRSAEVSIVHTFDDAKRYIQAVSHPGIVHINGDVYHMQSEEANIPETIVEAGEMLINLHLADSNRSAVGAGSMDFDAIIMALYLIDFQKRTAYVTPEPLGPGGDPYPAMFSRPDSDVLDKMVAQSVEYFRRRESEVKNLVS